MIKRKEENGKKKNMFLVVRSQQSDVEDLLVESMKNIFVAALKRFC